MASNDKKSHSPGGADHPGSHLDDDRDLDQDFLDDPEALLAAEEAALEAEELLEEEQGEKKERETPATLKAQIADLTDRLLRAHADMENHRKMAEKERADTAKYAISKFATDIVQIGDNFQRAITAVPGEAVDSDPALKSFLDGVSMLDREFHNILERHDIQRLEPTGEAFDPHFHQAMMEQEDASVPHGTVLQVIQTGYQLADRVLRPAMVVVAKGGAKPGAQKPQPEAPQADNENAHAASGQSQPNSNPSGSGPDPDNT